MIQRWILLSLALFTSAALAESTPAGLWRTIDDHTGKEKSLVRIVEVNGEFRGTIEKLFREPGEDPNPNCDKCTGDKKNKPVIGMMILTGLKKDNSQWAGGEILDPQNGKIYRCKAWLENKGHDLHVRGFIGMALLGRTQIWKREE
jgi:uncharacterized protein (DUF2147 family)